MSVTGAMGSFNKFSANRPNSTALSCAQKTQPALQFGSLEDYKFLLEEGKEKVNGYLGSKKDRVKGYITADKFHRFLPASIKEEMGLQPKKPKTLGQVMKQKVRKGLAIVGIAGLSFLACKNNQLEADLPGGLHVSGAHLSLKQIQACLEQGTQKEVELGKVGNGSADRFVFHCEGNGQSFETSVSQTPYSHVSDFLHRFVDLGQGIKGNSDHNAGFDSTPQSLRKRP